MFRGHTLTKTIRQWGLIVWTGVGGFAVGIAGFAFFGLDGILSALNALPAVVAGVILSGLLALATLAIGALFALSRERWRNRMSRIALNNMTQGLCMFDSVGAARSLQYALHRNAPLAARAIAGRHAAARDACSPQPTRARSPAIRTDTSKDCLRKAAEGRTGSENDQVRRRAHYRAGPAAAAGRRLGNDAHRHHRKTCGRGGARYTAHSARGAA